MNNEKWLKISVAALCMLTIATTGALLVQNGRAEDLSDANDATLRRALYQSAELLGGLQGSILKLPASSAPAQEALLLSDIARQAFGVQENLAVLPADAQNLQGALKFVNQIQDYATTLTASLASGGALGENDHAQLQTLADSSAQLQRELLRSAESLTAIDFSAPEIQDGTKGQQPSVEYPSLIYDGPFSDGAKSSLIPALSGDTIDIDTAQEIARRYIGESRVRQIRGTGEIALPVPCFEFEAETDQEMLTICVTKTGGKVLYMLTDGSIAQENRSEGECIDAAANFLDARGYGPMLPTYWTHADGYLTVNFAAVQDGILLYPDLVKVEVSMESAQVVGIEARNYLANHVPRTLAQPVISLEEAQAALNSRINVSGSRLCVIPTDPGEALCWEFSGDIAGSGSYLVYIDAMSGKEREILRLIETEHGLVTQ